MVERGIDVGAVWAGNSGNYAARPTWVRAIKNDVGGELREGALVAACVAR